MSRDITITTPVFLDYFTLKVVVVIVVVVVIIVVVVFMDVSDPRNLPLKFG